MNETNNNFRKAAGAIEESLANFTVGLFKKSEKEKKPSRFPLVVIGIAAFSMLTLLDLIASVVVGLLTNFLYGLLVFSIGVGSLLIAAVGHFFAYAGRWQKVIAIVDGITSIGSTLLIGSLAALVYAVQKFGVFDFTNHIFWVEVGVVVLLVIVGVTHAVLWLAYVLIDRGVKMNQDYQNKAAESEMFQKGFSLAENLIAKQLATGQRFQNLVAENKGVLLRENLKDITGQDVSVLASSNGNGNGKYGNPT